MPARTMRRPHSGRHAGESHAPCAQGAAELPARLRGTAADAAAAALAVAPVRETGTPSSEPGTMAAPPMFGAGGAGGGGRPPGTFAAATCAQ